MTIRILTDNGINEFLTQLHEIRTGARQELSSELLASNAFTSSFESDIEIEDNTFKNKQEIIQYICEKLQLKSNKHLYYHRGLWSWLAAFYFKSLTSIKDGKPKVNEDAKYILM